jgi:hypothetical protein
MMSLKVVSTSLDVIEKIAGQVTIFQTCSLDITISQQVRVAELERLSSLHGLTMQTCYFFVYSYGPMKHQQCIAFSLLPFLSFQNVGTAVARDPLKPSTISSLLPVITRVAAVRLSPVQT